MADYDLVVRGGTVVTGGRHVPLPMSASAMAASPRWARRWRARTTLDAGGLLVMPGGVDTHCHIEQLRPNGGADEESFVTGSTACLAGGTTTVITFAAQFKGHGIRDTLAEYQRRAPQGDGGLQLPPDHHRSRRTCVVRDEIPRGGRLRHAQPEGVPDLRAARTWTTASSCACWPPRGAPARW